MPQLDIFTFMSQIFWLICSLSLIFVFINYYFLPLVYSSLKVRLIKNIDLYKNLDILRKDKNKLLNQYDFLIKMYVRENSLLIRNINYEVETYNCINLKNINKNSIDEISNVTSRSSCF